MRVLVFETSMHGHRANYLRLILPALERLGVEVILSTGKAVAESVEFQTLVAPNINATQVEFNHQSTLGGPYRHASYLLNCLSADIKRYSPNRVLVTTADGLCQVSVCKSFTREFRRCHLEGIMHGGRFAFPAKNWKESIGNRLNFKATQYSVFNTLHFINDLVYDWIHKNGRSLVSRSRFLPDPIDVPEGIELSRARTLLALPQGIPIIGCVGVIGGHKGIGLLLNAFAENLIGDDVQLLLFGQHSDAIRKQLSHHPRRNQILSIDRYATFDELHQAICALDLICLPHPNHAGISSIALRAAAMRRQILSSDYGWIAQFIRKTRVGRCCDVRSPAAFAREAMALLDSPINLPPNVIRETYESSNFVRAIAAPFRRST